MTGMSVFSFTSLEINKYVQTRFNRIELSLDDTFKRTVKTESHSTVKLLRDRVENDEMVCHHEN